MKIMITSLFLLVFCANLLHAQGDTITANLNAWKLRPIWRMVGQNDKDEVGSGVGTVGDINGDGYDEVALLSANPLQWSVYFGDAAYHDMAHPPTLMWKLDSGTSTPPHPVLGDFWGTGHNAVGFGRTQVDTSTGKYRIYYRLYIYRTDDGRLPDTPAAIFDPARTNPTISIGLHGAFAADLDRDGADELIVLTGGAIRNDVLSLHPEAWIYKGGPNFRLDTPTVIIRDPEAQNTNGHLYSAVGDLDGDARPDLVWQEFYGSPGTWKRKIFFSAPGSPLFFDTIPHTIEADDVHPYFDSEIPLADCDGDQVQDMMLGRYLYRSGSKNARTRTFNVDDADAVFQRPNFDPIGSGGYMNDRRHKYEMFAGIQGSYLILFSGGPNGADNRYDAYYSWAEDGYANSAFGNMRPCGDVTGDGWPEYITGNPIYGFNAGVAVLLSGSPEIPRDDGSSGVRDIHLENHAAAVSYWPNPMRDELNIAWRGDLDRTPHGFIVHDLFGRTIARGEVAPGTGAALWRCADVPAGVYLVTISDEHGVPIATVRVVKQ